jgi:prophage maintenance system killer protein
MEIFLVLNGSEIDAPTDAQEHLMLDLAAGRLDHRRLTDWLRQHLKPLG